MKRKRVYEYNKDDPTEVFYICDPAKATTCRKTTCYVNGGDCRFTTRPDWERTEKER